MKKDEEGYKNELERIFKQCGWNVRREAVPDNFLGKTWSPCYIDMIVSHPDHGVIGIEAKHLNSVRQGGKIIDAVNQVKRYQEHIFNGQKIDRWCLALRMDYFGETSTDSVILIKTLLNKLGYSFLEYDWEKQKISIDRNNKNSVIIGTYNSPSAYNIEVRKVMKEGRERAKKFALMRQNLEEKRSQRSFSL